METLQRVSKTQSIYTEKSSVKSVVRFNPAIKCRKRADNSLELGYKLLTEAEKQNDFQSLVDADFLIESGQFGNANHSYFDNVSDKQGRLFSAPVQFVSVPTRLDSGSQRRNAYSNRQRIIKQFEAIANELENGSLKAYFITPTFTNLIGKNLQQNVEFIDEVAKQFRDDDYYKKTFVGAYKKTEFTDGKAKERWKKNIAFDYRIHGYNFHNHYLFATKLEFGDTSKDCKKYCRENHNHICNRENSVNIKLTKLYTRILKQVHFEMFGERLKFETESGLAVVDVRPVEINFDADGKIIREKSRGFIYEAAKYLAKPGAFNNLEPSELLAANKIFRNKKLVSSTGIFNQKSGRKKKEKTNNFNNLQENEKPNSLDKQPSSILKKAYSLINYHGSEDIEKSLSSIFSDYKNNSCKTLTLKKIGILLCQNGMRELWLKILKIEFKKQVADARRRFLERHPNAIVTDLRGNTYSNEKFRQMPSQNRLMMTH
jgi:hypothetical protein